MSRTVSVLSSIQSLSLRVTLVGALTASSLLLAACGSDAATGPDTQPPVPQPVATTLQLADPGLVRDGDVVTLSAEVRDNNGQLMPQVPVSYATTDSSVLLVNAQGQLTALREGSAQVIARAAALESRRSIGVAPHPAASIQLSVTQMDLTIGASGTVGVTVRGLDGRVLNGRTLEWTSENPAIAWVAATGAITAVAPGNAVITVRHGTLAATVQVRVLGAVAQTPYQVAKFNGTPLPAVVDQFADTLDNGTIKRYVARLESGTVGIGDNYSIALQIVAYEVTEMGGNTIMRVVGRNTITDRGTARHDFLNGHAQLSSEATGSLEHMLRPTSIGTLLEFRVPGTYQYWQLTLRLQ
jgi:hypothetical protein